MPGTFAGAIAADKGMELAADLSWPDACDADHGGGLPAGRRCWLALADDWWSPAEPY